MRQILDKKCGMYNISVQAIRKHKHIIFRHLSPAVDSTACHNINKTVIKSLIKRIQIIFCGILPNYSKKIRKKLFPNFKRIIQAFF